MKQHDQRKLPAIDECWHEKGNSDEKEGLQQKTTA